MDSGNKALQALAHQAHEALDGIARSPEACPSEMDRFDWSAPLLDELARTALRLAEAAAVAGDGSDEDIERLAQALATAIVRRRNEALTPRPLVPSPSRPMAAGPLRPLAPYPPRPGLSTP